MATLKTYSISVDFTNGFDHGTFSDEVIASASVTGFEGVMVNGDDVNVCGDSYTEAALDAVVAAHVWPVSETSTWKAPKINMGDGATSGVALFRAGGGGLQYAFDGGSDDEWSSSIALGDNYDGSDLKIRTTYQLSTGPGAGDTVEFEVEYSFTAAGDDSDADGTTFTDAVDQTGRGSGELYTDLLPTTLSGVADKTHLQLSIKRDSLGGSSDSFAGAIWVISFELIKV